MAVGIRNWWLKHNGFDYSAELPALCHQYLREGSRMPEQAMQNLQSLAAKVSGNEVSDLQSFVNQYLDVFSRGFHYAFIAAVVMICVSAIIFLVNQKKFPDPSKKEVAAQAGATSASEVQMSAAEIKQRIYALFAVFGVVIFFLDVLPPEWLLADLLRS